LTWHDVASVRMKLEVPATQRHHRECAVSARYFTSSVSLLTAYIFVKRTRTHKHVSSTVEQAAKPQLHSTISKGPAGNNRYYMVPIHTSWIPDA